MLKYTVVPKRTSATFWYNVGGGAGYAMVVSNNNCKRLNPMDE
jgi:hypothetical protein